MSQGPHTATPPESSSPAPVSEGAEGWLRPSKTLPPVCFQVWFFTPFSLLHKTESLRDPSSQTHTLFPALPPSLRAPCSSPGGPSLQSDLARWETLLFAHAPKRDTLKLDHHQRGGRRASRVGQNPCVAESCRRESGSHPSGAMGVTLTASPSSRLLERVGAIPSRARMGGEPCSGCYGPAKQPVSELVFSVGLFPLAVPGAAIHPPLHLSSNANSCCPQTCLSRHSQAQLTQARSRPWLRVTSGGAGCSRFGRSSGRAALCKQRGWAHLLRHWAPDHRTNSSLATRG